MGARQQFDASGGCVHWIRSENTSNIGWCTLHFGSPGKKDINSANAAALMISGDTTVNKQNKDPNKLNQRNNNREEDNRIMSIESPENDILNNLPSNDAKNKTDELIIEECKIEDEEPGGSCDIKNAYRRCEERCNYVADWDMSCPELMFAYSCITQHCGCSSG